MKNKRLWLSVALTVLVVVCAMLILSRVNEARSNAAPAAPTDLILPPDIQTTAKPDTKKYDDLPDVVAALRALRAAGKYPDNIW